MIGKKEREGGKRERAQEKEGGRREGEAYTIYQIYFRNEKELFYSQERYNKNIKKYTIEAHETYVKNSR